MVLVALEQSEPPGRRLVDDDLAARFLPAPTRWLVTATPPNLMRQLTMAAMEREGPGLWASMNCRKRYIADMVNESLDDIDAVVVLGAGFDVLTGHGYRPDSRTFFVWEAVTQYLSAEAVASTLKRLRQATSGSRLVFTYVRRDFIDGINLYGADALYRRFRQRQQLWQFGMAPQEVAAFLAGHGWQLAEQAGPDLIMRRYVVQTGRQLTVSPIEWSAYAEKT
jgi:O-methyltransferase involved in polyketide biosynthesis